MHHGVRVLDVEVWGRVRGAQQHLAFQRAHRRGVLEHVCAEGARDQQPLPVPFDQVVVGGSINGRSGVGRERPGGGGPHQEGRTGQLRISGNRHEREPDEDARVLDGFIPLGDLSVGECRPAPGAVGRDLVGLLEQTPPVEGFERPPDGLDVLGVHGPVGVGHVQPEADALGQLFPIAHIAPDRLAAAQVELGHPECLDVALALGADLLLDLDLHGQAMAVPSRLAMHVVAGHRLEARVDILERAGDGVADMGLGVRGRGAVVEHPFGGALALAQRRLEDPLSVPEAQDARFHLREADLLIHRFEPRHLVPLPTCETPRPLQGRGVGPAVPPRLPPAGGGRPLRAAEAAIRCYVRSRLRLLRRRAVRHRFGQGLGEDARGDPAPGSHRPRLARAVRPPRPCSRRRL